jgi:uncharacterized membrane protein required for colicin V production
MLATLVWIDWVFIAIFIISVLRGLSHGLVKQVLSLVSLFVSLFLAERWAPMVANWLNGQLAAEGHVAAFLSPMLGGSRWEPIAVAVLSFLLVWCFIGIFFYLLEAFLESVARLPLLSSVNRLGGAALGVLRGGFIVFVLASFISFLPSSTDLGKVAQDSYISAQVKTMSPVLYQQLQGLAIRVWQDSIQP